MLSNGEEISVAEVNALVLVRTFATIAFYKFYALKNNHLALRALKCWKTNKKFAIFGPTHQYSHIALIILNL
jgi:hypothetical protein